MKSTFDGVAVFLWFAKLIAQMFCIGGTLSKPRAMFLTLKLRSKTVGTHDCFELSSSLEEQCV